jgi:flagellar biosynthetic protein FliP
MKWLSALPVLLVPTIAQAQTAIPGALDRAFGATGGTGGQGMTLSLQLLVIMGLLTLLPGLLLMMTSFTRILGGALNSSAGIGLQQSPPNQVLDRAKPVPLAVHHGANTGKGERSGHRALQRRYDQR